MKDHGSCEPIPYVDSVFGHQLITDDVIIKLIQGKSLQRLRGIDQAGYPDPFFPNVQKRTRFEHSIGVYLLLRRYNASLEEQIAGLIHDVSHTAFSHCIDYSLGNAEAEKTHSHQDNIFETFVRQSEIPGILAQYGFSIDSILDEQRFPLKEKSLPDLCADRLDYSLRAAVALDPPLAIDGVLESLKSNGRAWYFDTVEAARRYAELFSHLNTLFWSGLPSAMMFRTVGDCLGYAIRQHYLDTSDLFTTDGEVLERLTAFVPRDPHLQKLFDRMNRRVAIAEDPDNYESAVFCKSRVVDPLCLHNGTCRRLSDIDPSWRLCVEQQSTPKVYYLKFENPTNAPPEGGALKG
jgi:hypothetical protein